MSGKGKLERAEAPGPVSTNKYSRWREAVVQLLGARLGSQLLDIERVAATVVGMFDAGATNAEVAAFIRSEEHHGESPILSDDERLSLVRELHESATHD
jgi:hypothetical protein